MNTMLFFDALVHGAIRTDSRSFDGVISVPGRFPKKIFRTLLAWRKRTAYRRQLREMDEHMLTDIGFSRAEALREVYKPFWRR